MKKYILTVVPILIILFSLSACGCEHEWVDATCNTPKTCSFCQKIEGSPLGHRWLDATCTSPKSCSLCAISEGNCLPHTPGSVESEIDYIRAVSIESQSCTVCNTVLSTEEKNVSLVSEDLFVLNAEEFVSRLNSIYTLQEKNDWAAALEITLMNETEMCTVFLRKGDVVYARFFLSARENDPDTQQVMTPIQANQTRDRIIFNIPVTINYNEIAKQLNDWDNADSNQRRTWLLEVYDQGDSIFKDILGPIYLALSPTLSTEEIDAALMRGIENTLNFLSTNIIYQEQCGDFYTEYLNLFSVAGAHIINVSATPEHWMDPNNLS